MSRWAELIEGSDGKFSSSKLLTYIVTITLCYVMITRTLEGESVVGLATVAATLAAGVLGINQLANVSIAKAAAPTPPAVTVNQMGAGDNNVQPSKP